ncbi:MAG: RiPP maturation radical SAM C-methyltransferase [Ignavibacteriae bacterium]|nr:RiPP maturation radical SAM C-methyltransferase [Ignavibacteriota bacterium]
MNPNVLLISMPWAPLNEPSIGLGILKTILIEKKINVKVVNLNIYLLEYLTADTYVSLADIFALNDFLFTHCFETNVAPKQERELEKIIDYIQSFKPFKDTRYQDRDSIRKLLLTLRNEIIPQYLNYCLEIVSTGNHTMIGFTCLFDQTIPSLALAKLIKRKFPNKFIVFGGYALEGITGYQIKESFDFVDCVYQGEGEEAIEKLAYASIKKNNLSEIPGLIFRGKDDSQIKVNPKALPINLDCSPIPNYDDFLNDLNEMANKHNVFIKWERIPVETSRGCWWGQVKHCIFCGIDDVTMKYRRKNVERSLEMFYYLKEKYNKSIFRICDYILPYDYFKTLLPVLANSGKINKMFFSCELKANLSYENVKILKEAGFTEVQPGIESFSTNVLKKIDKGVSSIQNIYVLLLGRMFKLSINYNFLYGFSDDEIYDYEKLLKIIPYLYHLDPPCSRLKVAVTRFAPMQVDPKRFYSSNRLTYKKAYNVIFSPKFIKTSNFNLNNYCYYFESPYENSEKLRFIYEMILFQIDHWKYIKNEREVNLTYKISSKGISFTDTRYSKYPNVIRFGRKQMLLYSLCSKKIVTTDFLRSQLSKLDVSISNVDKILKELIDYRFIIKENNKVLGLAINEG